MNKGRLESPVLNNHECVSRSGPQTWSQKPDLGTQQRGLGFILSTLTLPVGMRAMELTAGKELKDLVSNRTLLEWTGR